MRDVGVPSHLCLAKFGYAVWSRARRHVDLAFADPAVPARRDRALAAARQLELGVGEPRFIVLCGRPQRGRRPTE
jgi:hypothetical protein